jgi:mRNA interferase RelE/StbE
MSTAKLLVPDEVAGVIRELHPDLKKKIKTGLKIILANPSEGKALKSDLSGLNSFRVGKFRIVYKIQGAVVAIIAIGPRKTIYEETARLVRKQTDTAS